MNDDPLPFDQNETTENITILRTGMTSTVVHLSHIVPHIPSQLRVATMLIHVCGTNIWIKRVKLPCGLFRGQPVSLILPINESKHANSAYVQSQ